MSSIMGTLSVDNILLIYIPAMILTPAYTYHMAVSHGQEKPFPSATVTSTACHYPQDIVFRYVMLICSSIIALSFFVEFRWARWQALRTGFKPLSEGYLWAAWFSIACYGVTIGTIDEKGIGKLHGPCAVTFFIIFLITIVRLTFYYKQLRKWDSSTISWCSLALKKILSFYIVAVWLYCLFMILTAQSQQNHSDQYVVIVEWNSVVINLLWLLSSVIDWRRLKLAMIKR